MKMRRLNKHRHWIAAALSLAMVFALNGCGGDAASDPPTEYRIGEDALPALNAVVALGGDVVFSEEASEAETVSYQYTQLESGQAVVEEYVAALVDVYGCDGIQEDGQSLAPDVSAESGEVRVGMASNSGTGIFSLLLQWDAASCTVTPEYEAETTLHTADGPISIEEAVGVLDEALEPQDQGAERGLAAYPKEGIVLVDERPYYCIDVYWEDTHQIAGSYLVSADGNTLYQLDRDTKQIKRLAGA